VNAAILIDKPTGMTSMDVIRRARKKANIKKIGHAGTLDPLATGLLVVLFGKATKLQDIFQNAQKAYTGTIRLGLRTETLDIDGKEHVLSEVSPKLFEDPKIIEHLIKKFSGDQMQMPPIYSALKVSGVSSHKLARQGVEVKHKERKVNIQFNSLKFESSQVLSFDVFCSKGTYIRSLARDVGEELGCGACIESLRRTLSSPFKLEDAVTLEQFLEDDVDKHIMSMAEMVSHMPKIEVSQQDLHSLRLGQQHPLEKAVFPEKGDLAAIFSGAEFGGLAQRADSATWKLKFVIS